MVRLIRIFSFLLIAAGILVLGTWAIQPLRFIWPWLRGLPWPILLGVGAAGAGLILMFSTLIWERIEDRSKDRELLDQG